MCFSMIDRLFRGKVPISTIIDIDTSLFSGSEDVMQFEAANLEASISQEKWTDYWRERAECLEEWVCELLRKNQALRMTLQKEQPQQLCEETSPAQSSPGVYRPGFSPERPGSRTEPPN